MGPRHSAPTGRPSIARVKPLDDGRERHRSPNGTTEQPYPCNISKRALAMPQSFGSLYFHLVFSSKHRQPLIDAEWQSRLYEYCGGILRREKSVLLAAGGMPDHVHLLVSLSRELSIADVVRLVKASSSK